MNSAAGETELMQKVQSLVWEERYAEAVPYLEELRRHHPDDQTILFSLGRGYIESGEPAKAGGCFERVLGLAPDSQSSLYLYGMAQGQCGQIVNARVSFERVLMLNPDHLPARISLGVLMQAYGYPMLALEHLEKARGLAPDHPEVNVRLGRLHIELNEYENASGFFRTALNARPGYPEALCGLASLCAYGGDAPGAYRLLEPLLEKNPVNITAATSFAEICRPLDCCDRAKALLEVCLQGNLSREDSSRIHFSLGKLYDREACYDQAFEHYRLGNEFADRDYDPWLEGVWFREMITMLNREFFMRMPRISERPELPVPVFIVGMPRSGTTLVEQILAAHPAVHGCGELTEIPAIAQALPGLIGTSQPYPRCLEQADGAVFDNLASRYLGYLAARLPEQATVATDKMPDNYQYLGLIQLMLPWARVIHCRRDPLDNCLSCYFQNFASGHFYSYDLQNLGLYYNLYERLMSHWQLVLDLPVMEVHYEELVVEPEKTSRSLIEFCGLEWDDACMNFHAADRSVVTASFDQVRQPLYTSSVGRWEFYDRYLAPLREGLGKRIV